MYQILYHQLVVKEDLRKIPSGLHEKILRAINGKLSLEPEIFGKPLLRELKGYYRLRLDPYRIIYRIEKEKIIVMVIHIGLRKDFAAYISAAKRLGLV